MSLNSLFSTARQGLLAAQASTNATANNVANSETAGYTRRSATVRMAAPASSGLLISSTPGVGGGTGGVSFARIRSGILDQTVRDGRAGSDGAGESAGLLAALEAGLVADGDAFLEAVSDFFGAWADVAIEPSDLPARDSLLIAGDTLTNTLRTADARLTDFAASVQDELGDTVISVNSLLSEVADLNAAIRASQARGADELDALDRRDVVLDELAGLAPFAAQLKSDGTVTVTLDGMVAVQGTEARPLRLVLPPAESQPAIYTSGGPRPVKLDSLSSGALGAQINILTSTVPNVRTSLNAIAAEVVAGVNAAHSTGVGLDGSTGLDFFDPAGVTASSIARNPALTAKAIGAGTTGPGDGSIADRIADLGESASVAAATTIIAIGLEAKRAATTATANEAYTAHATALRDGVSGVSLDEEMANLVRYQQAYAASARVLETSSALFDTILAL